MNKAPESSSFALIALGGLMGLGRRRRNDLAKKFGYPMIEAEVDVTLGFLYHLQSHSWRFKGQDFQIQQ